MKIACLWRVFGSLWWLNQLSTNLTDWISLGRQPRPATGSARPVRYSPGLDHRGDEAQLSRLRHERDRGARAAGCARRAQAGASPHPLFDALEPAYARQEI